VPFWKGVDIEDAEKDLYIRFNLYFFTASNETLEPEVGSFIDLRAKD